jgi:hypothetical protein
VNIVTMATADELWLDIFAARWLRKARESNPAAKLCLILIGGTKGNPFAQLFDEVACFPQECANRPFFNEARMKATEIFGVEEICWVDCDCDIKRPLDDLPQVSDKELLFCYAQPTAYAPEWAHVSNMLGYGQPKNMANNGFLYMRRSFEEEYKAARARIEEIQAKSRIGGLLCFNTMLKMYPDLAAAAPYYYSVVADDYTTDPSDKMQWLRKARCIQYCAQRNQDKLLRHELEWRRAQ